MFHPYESLSYLEHRQILCFYCWISSTHQRPPFVTLTKSRSAKNEEEGRKKNQYTPFRLSAMHYFRYYPENNTVLTDEIILYLPKIFCLVLLICQKPSNKHKQHQTLVGHTRTSKASKRCKEKKLLWLEFTTAKPLINTLHAERDASIDRPHFTRLPLNER